MDKIIDQFAKQTPTYQQIKLQPLNEQQNNQQNEPQQRYNTPEYQTQTQQFQKNPSKQQQYQQQQQQKDVVPQLKQTKKQRVNSFANKLPQKTKQINKQRILQNLNKSNNSFKQNDKLNTSISKNTQMNMIVKTDSMAKQLIPIKPNYFQNRQSRLIKKSMTQIMKNKQIQDLVPFIQQKYTSNTRNVPQSVKSLDHYCQRFGLLPMGSISKSPGDMYIGRGVIHGKDNKIHHDIVQFGDSWFIQTPDIGRNLCYFSNKAVQKWNQFVKAQSDLLVFANKISSKQQQDQYMERTARGCSNGTSLYKILATLYYFYIQQNKNILDLQPPDVFLLSRILKTQGKIRDVAQQVGKVIQKSSNSKVDFILKYIENKKKSLKISLQSSLYQKISEYIEDQFAYLDENMINFPKKQVPDWINKFSGINMSANIFSTDLWEPSKQYFFADNYLKF